MGRSQDWGRGRGRSQQLRRRRACAAQDVPVASDPSSQGGTCMAIGQCGREAVAIGPRLRLLGGRCPDAGAGRSGASGADWTGRAGTGAGANGGARAASRPGRGSGSHGRPGGAGVRWSAGRSRVRGPSLAPGRDGWARTLGFNLPWDEGIAVPVSRAAGGLRVTVSASVKPGHPSANLMGLLEGFCWWRMWRVSDTQ